MTARKDPAIGPPTKIQRLMSWFHPLAKQSKIVKARAAAGLSKLWLEVIVYLVLLDSCTRGSRSTPAQ